MSGFVTGAVLDRYPGGGGERMVAVALADNAHRDGTHIWPSVAEIAARSRLSERSVQVHLARMVQAGWLILTRKSSGRRGDTNEYRICPAWLAGGVCTPPEAPVLRTNLKNPDKTAAGPWGAETAPHKAVDKSAGWGAENSAMGCSLEHHGVKPTAPKPPGTEDKPNTPLPPTGGEREFETQAENGIGDGFLEFWGVWPKKVDKAVARRAWATLAPGAALQASIIAAVRAWADRPEWRQDDGRWIPKHATWLRNGRWTDLPGITLPGGPATTGPPKPPPEPDKPAAPAPESVRAYRASLGRRTVRAPAHAEAAP